VQLAHYTIVAGVCQIHNMVKAVCHGCAAAVGRGRGFAGGEWACRSRRRILKFAQNLGKRGQGLAFAGRIVYNGVRKWVVVEENGGHPQERTRTGVRWIKSFLVSTNMRSTIRDG
jgi:hypothetical protein